MSYTSIPSTSSMTSTFTLLMKIVRDLALNRDDPEGREHHKHFVEQQFINSNVRIDRVINECNNDLTKLIQIFDLILRRVERTRRELSTFLFSVRNCKQLLLVRRSECRKLWFQSVEHNTLVSIYDQLIELKKVKGRCQMYLINGYLFHAIELVELATKIFNDKFNMNKFNSVDIFDNELMVSTDRSRTDDNLHSDFDRNSRLSRNNKYKTNVMKELSKSWMTSTSSNENNDHMDSSGNYYSANSGQMCVNVFSVINDEIQGAGKEIFRSLCIALEVAIFDGIFDKELLAKSPYSNSIYGFDYRCDRVNSSICWSEQMCSFWKSIHKRKNNLINMNINNDISEANNDYTANENVDINDDNDGGSVKDGLLSTKYIIPSLDVDQLDFNEPKSSITINSVLIDPLSFENNPTLLSIRPSLFNSFPSKVDYIAYIVSCANKLSIISNAADKLKDYIASVLARRLDSILVDRAGLIMSCQNITTPTNSLSSHTALHFRLTTCSSSEENSTISTTTQNSSLIEHLVLDNKPLRKNRLKGEHQSINTFSEILSSVNLTNLLMKSYEHYERIADSCKILIDQCNTQHSQLSGFQTRKDDIEVVQSLQKTDVRVKDRKDFRQALSTNEDLDRSVTGQQLNDIFIWSTIQQPLVAVLFVHIIKDLENIVQKQNVFGMYADIFVNMSTGRKYEFNSELILKICSKISHEYTISSINEISKQNISGNERLKTDTRADNPQNLNDSMLANEGLPIDLDHFFLDINVSSISHQTTHVFPGISSKSHLLSSTKDTVYSIGLDSRSTSYNRQKMNTVTPVIDNKRYNMFNLEGKLFKFSRSAQVQSLAQYYKDLEDKKSYIGQASSGSNIVSSTDGGRRVPENNGLIKYDMSTNVTKIGGNTTVNNIRDFLGIYTVIVCPPSYRNIHYIYHKLMHICALIDKQTDERVKMANKCGNDIMTDIDNSNYLRLTLLKDNIRYFVRDIYFLNLRSDIHRRITDNLPSSAILTKLLPVKLLGTLVDDNTNVECDRNSNSGGLSTDVNRKLSFREDNAANSIPIFFYTYLAVQAVEELVSALYDMNAFTDEFWIAINEIIVQHTATCSSNNMIFTGIIKTPLCIEWVRDVDVNRHLRSMPILRNLLESNKQLNDVQSSDLYKPLTTQSMLYDSKSARRKSILLTFGHDCSSSVSNREIKSVQSIISNLAQDNQLIADHIITDYRKIRAMANQHESMMWFVNRFYQIIRKNKRSFIKRRSVVIDNVDDDDKMHMIEDELVASSIQQARHIAEDILLTIYVEVRAHCFYHLMTFNDPINLLQYAAEITSTSNDNDHHIYRMQTEINSADNSKTQCGYNNKFIHSTEDIIIQTLCRDLIRLHESMLGVLTIPKIEFIFSGLNYLFAFSFIELTDKLSTISNNGIKKMRQNILSIHSCLLNLSRQRNTISCVESSCFQNQSNVKNNFIYKNYKPTTLNSNSNVLTKGEEYNARLLKLSTSNTNAQERKELLRVLHFYDLLDCPNVEALLKRIEADFVPNQFQDHDYRSLVSLKFRNDRYYSQFASAIKSDSKLDGKFVNEIKNEQFNTDTTSSELDRVLSQLQTILTNHQYQEHRNKGLASSKL